MAFRNEQREKEQRTSEHDAREWQQNETDEMQMIAFALPPSFPSLAHVFAVDVSRSMAHETEPKSRAKRTRSNSQWTATAVTTQRSTNAA